MKTSLYLLACWVVALWVSMAIAAPHVASHQHKSRSTFDPYLKAIFDTIEKYNETIYNAKLTNNDADVEFVESARDFAQGPGRCGDKFFCAVYGILYKHRNSTQYSEHKTLMKNLENFLKHQDVNCSKVMKNPLNATVWVKMPEFLSDIKTCVNCRILNATSTSC
ncbi:hypothetical protein NL108_009457 [Boleophthalmus pectinirostris]|nr:hypothetical protein NL108_009457 [Boleophthalmus pectinirostris]